MSGENVTPLFNFGLNKPKIPFMGNSNFTQVGMQESVFTNSPFLNILNQNSAMTGYDSPFLVFLRSAEKHDNLLKDSYSGAVVPYRRCNLSAKCKEQISEIAKEINCDPRAIESVIMAESGGNPAAVNPKSGASGLIQFMPSTIASMNKLYGTNVTIQQIRNMSAEEQMPYVRQYFLMARKQAGFAANEKLSGGQTYALVFCPANAKKKVLFTSNSGAAFDWNKGLADGNEITVDSLERRLRRYS